jgi:hypothetical protein
MALARRVETFTAAGDGTARQYSSGDVVFAVSMTTPGDGVVVLKDSVDNSTYDIRENFTASTRGQKFTPIAGMYYRWTCVSLQSGKTITVEFKGIEA